MVRRVTFADLIPQNSMANHGEAVAQTVRMRDTVPRSFLRQIAPDPHMQDWLISCSETRRNPQRVPGLIGVFHAVDSMDPKPRSRD